MILVDSSVWIAYFNGQDSPEAATLDSLLGVEPLAMGDLVLTEVLQGFRSDADYRTARELLTSLTLFTLGGPEIALKAADNFRALRKRGITVRKTIDALIATYCIEHHHSLLHADRDFLPFAEHLGLRTVRSGA